MRLGLSIMTLFRSPVKTLVTFLLLITVGFAFVSRGAEYTATAEAVAGAEENYVARGTISMTLPAYAEHTVFMENRSTAVMPLTQEAIDLVRSSNYIESSEVRYVAGGTTSSYMNVTEQPLFDVPGASSSEINWGNHLNTFEMDSAFVVFTCDSNAGSVVNATIDDVMIGAEECFRPNQSIHLYVPDYKDATLIEYGLVNPESAIFYDQLADGHQYFAVLTTWGNSPYSQDKQLSDTVDCPLIDLTRLKEEHGTTDFIAALSDPETYGIARYESGNYVPTAEYLGPFERNFHTSELVYTNDMNGLVRYHDEFMFITEGRAITGEDGGNICVVSTNYAQKNGLSVGDTIEFEVSADTMEHSGKVFGRQPPFIEHESIWNELHLQDFSDLGLEPVTVSYEIVGLWSDTVNQREADPFAYSLNTVFVPDDTYPWADTVAPRLLPSTFSFTLKHPGDMELIEAELGEQLESLGYEFSINDLGYADAQHSLMMMRLSALIGFVSMSAAMVLSLVLITYLFIIRRKYDYAIMRALGTPIDRANRTLLIGLAALSITATVVGCAAALVTTRSISADLAAKIAEITGREAAMAAPVWTIGVFGVGILALLFIFARIGLTRIAKKSPLRLLQGR